MTDKQTDNKITTLPAMWDGGLILRWLLNEF